MLQWQRGWLLRLHICCPFWMAFRMGPLSMPTFLPLAHWRTTSSHLSMLSTRCASAGLDSPLAIPPSPALLLTYSRCSRRGRDRSPQALWRSHLLLWPLLLHPQPKPVKVCALQHSAGYSPGHHPVDPWILWRRRWQHVPVRAAGCVRGQAGAHTHTHARTLHGSLAHTPHDHARSDGHQFCLLSLGGRGRIFVVQHRPGQAIVRHDRRRRQPRRPGGAGTRHPAGGARRPRRSAPTVRLK